MNVKVRKKRQKEHIRASMLAVGSSLLLILFALLIVVVGYGDAKVQRPTGFVPFETQKVVSSAAFVEVDGIAYPITLPVIQAREGEFIFNITNLELDLTGGKHTVRVIDKDAVVVEAEVTVTDGKVHTKVLRPGDQNVSFAVVLPRRF